MFVEQKMIFSEKIYFLVIVADLYEFLIISPDIATWIHNTASIYPHSTCPHNALNSQNVSIKRGRSKDSRGEKIENLAG